MRVAYCAVPKPGGLYTFYRALREALAPHGIEVICAAVGRDSRKWRDEFVFGACERVADERADPSAAAEALVAWVERQGIDVVIPAYCRAAQVAAAFLPAEVAVVQRCWGITPAVYERVVAPYPDSFRIVCESPRQQHDLQHDHGVAPERLMLIPNAVRPEQFLHDKAPGPADQLRIGVVSRLDHEDKGMLYLPAIVQAMRLDPRRWSMDILGSGPVEEQLRRRLQPFIESRQVTMYGQVTPAEVLARLAELDVVLIPSRREGFGYTLVEAMAARCVPVASRIVGVTDWIVRDGETGVLCPVGDAEAFARAIEGLAADRARRHALALAAQHDAQRRFAVTQFGEAWANVLREAADAQRTGGAWARSPQERALLQHAPRRGWGRLWPFRRQMR